MSLDLGQAMRDSVREVVREEIRAALKEFVGGSLGADAPLDLRQAAAFVGCHKNTVSSWVKRGLLPSSGKGRLLRVKRADLLLVLERLAVPVVVESPESIADRVLRSVR